MIVSRRNNYDLFDELFKDPFFTNTFDRRDSSLMRTDIQETDQAYILDMELPGYHKEDVQAELKDGYLTITANKNTPSDEKEPQRRYLRRERFSGTCKRSFYVGEEVRQEDIKAAFQDGILRLVIPKEVPKKVEEQPKYITIE